MVAANQGAENSTNHQLEATVHHYEINKIILAFAFEE